MLTLQCLVMYPTRPWAIYDRPTARCPPPNPTPGIRVLQRRLVGSMLTLRQRAEHTAGYSVSRGSTVGVGWGGSWLRVWSEGESRMYAPEEDVS